MEFNGKRVLFTSDLGFEGVSNILHRCWGDREKALVVTSVVRSQVLPLKPDHVLTSHGPRPQGMAFLQMWCSAPRKPWAHRRGQSDRSSTRFFV
jgi:hypothetical protein